MQVLNIINQVGPLPISAPFKAPLDGPALLVVTGSLWSPNTNVPMQMSVQLDGKSIGMAHLWSNGPSTHRCLPTLFLGFQLAYGPHTLQLAITSASTTSDLNDMFTAALLY